MLRWGLAVVLMVLLVGGPHSALASTMAAGPRACCGKVAGVCCCGAGQAACPAKESSCAACGQEKVDLALVTVQPTVKPRVAIPLYLLPESKPAAVTLLWVRSARGLGPAPPLPGRSPQAFLRVWLI